jgi:hypothetical protein
LGADLISVMFIKDYVILTFETTADDGRLIDSPQLTCMVWPSAARDTETLAVGAAGYRDALCNFIDASVTAVRDDPASGMQLIFGGPSLIIRPTPEETTGPDIATLHFPESNEWDVWRYGDGTFAYLTETL